MNGLAISAEALRKSFGEKEVLKDITFAVKAGSLFGFLGPNGAGKTTTTNILTGILLPSCGAVSVLGQPMHPDNEPLRRRIGTVHDSLGLFEQLSGEEHLLFSASIYGTPSTTTRSRAAELLELFELADAASSPIHQYSHGMKKKIALACALIHDPDVLFLDEPFEGMDAIGSRLVMDNLRLLADKGKTIFVTSHILDYVERICDEVCIVSDGRVAFQESMEAIRSRYTGNAAPLESIFIQYTAAKTRKTTLSWAAPEHARS
jgi:ABC-2 type transport system ATP-binding protein